MIFFKSNSKIFEVRIMNNFRCTFEVRIILCVSYHKTMAYCYKVIKKIKNIVVIMYMQLMFLNHMFFISSYVKYIMKIS